MNICSHTFEEYVKMVRDFHGYPAPGVIIGGFMVDLAYRYLPADGLFDAISETNKCLPDAIQLLTPCTIGNGWLSIINVGRFVLTLYDKITGQGIRVFIDAEKLELWPTIKQWYFKLVPKKQEDVEALINTIREAGASILGVQRVTVPQMIMNKINRGIDDALLSILAGTYQDIFLSQKNRSEGMQHFDFVMSEVYTA